MAMDDFKAMMDELTEQEIERLGVGSQLFQARHAEIMSDLESLENSMKKDFRKKEPAL